METCREYKTHWTSLSGWRLYVDVFLGPQMFSFDRKTLREGEAQAELCDMALGGVGCEVVKRIELIHY
jgi:hypothetical protein